MVVQTAGAGVLNLEINQGAAWRTSAATWTDGGLLMSDGTNVRLTENGTGGATLYYRQLA
jgi:hypothetical protein